MKPVPHGEPYAGKLHVRFDEGAGVPDNKGRPALLYTLLSPVIVQGILDYDDLPAAGETKEVVIPLTRPKFTRKIGTLTLLVQG